MPQKTVHCSICGHAITGSDFIERMSKLRRHRKEKHPKAFQESYEKIRSAVKHPEVSYKAISKRGERASIEAYPKNADPWPIIPFLDPEPIRQRKQLIANPQVQSYTDVPAKGLVRVLFRKDGSEFPEFALYAPKRAKSGMVNALNDAQFTDEGRGKWVLRTNKFNIFVYL
jgi:hypothetical protein